MSGGLWEGWGGEKESVIVLLLMIFKVMKSAHCYQMDACFITDILSIWRLLLSFLQSPIQWTVWGMNTLAGVCVCHITDRNYHHWLKKSLSFCNLVCFCKTSVKVTTELTELDKHLRPVTLSVDKAGSVPSR